MIIGSYILPRDTKIKSKLILNPINITAHTFSAREYGPIVIGSTNTIQSYPTLYKQIECFTDVSNKTTVYAERLYKHSEHGILLPYKVRYWHMPDTDYADLVTVSNRMQIGTNQLSSLSIALEQILSITNDNILMSNIGMLFEWLYEFDTYEWLAHDDYTGHKVINQLLNILEYLDRDNFYNMNIEDVIHTQYLLDSRMYAVDNTIGLSLVQNKKRGIAHSHLHKSVVDASSLALDIQDNVKIYDKTFLPLANYVNDSTMTKFIVTFNMDGILETSIMYNSFIPELCKAQEVQWLNEIQVLSNMVLSAIDKDKYDNCTVTWCNEELTISFNKNNVCVDMYYYDLALLSCYGYGATDPH